MELYGKAPFTRPVSLLDLNSLTGFCLFCFVYLSVSVFSASQRVQSFLVVRARIPRNRTRLISAFVLSSLPSYPSRYLFPNFPQISPSDPLDFFCPLARFSSHFFWLSQWSPVSIRFSPPPRTDPTYPIEHYRMEFPIRSSAFLSQRKENERANLGPLNRTAVP